MKIEYSSRLRLTIELFEQLTQIPMAAENKDKKERVFLSKKLELSIPHGHVRTTLDEEALNYRQSKLTEEPLKALLELRHKGGPAEPEVPDRLARNATDKEKAAHKKKRDAYEAAYTAYAAYKSEDYENLQVTAEVILHMQKLHKLLTREKPKAKDADAARKQKEKDDAKVADIINVLNDKPSVNRKAKSAFEARGYKERLGKVNLKDPKSIQARIEELRAEDKRVQHFLAINMANKTKYRIKTDAVVGLDCLLQRVVEEISEHAIRMGSMRGAKLIRNDAVILGKYQEMTTYPLWAELPHVRNLRARAERRALYEKAKKEAKRRAMIQHNRFVKSLAPEEQKDKKFEFTYISFEDQEVKNGHATKRERINPKTGEPSKVKRGRGDKVQYIQSYSYFWKGIDYEETLDETWNNSYYGPVGSICDTAAQLIMDEGEVDGGVRIGGSLKRFLSNVVVDLIYAVAPQLELYLKVTGAKTVDAKMVEAVVTGRILNSLETPHGQYHLNQGLQDLMSYIAEKTKECDDFQTTANQRKATLEVEVKHKPKAPAAEEPQEDEEAEGEGEEESGEGDEIGDEDLAEEETPKKTPAPKVAAPKAPAPKANGKAVEKKGK